MSVTVKNLKLTLTPLTNFGVSDELVAVLAPFYVGEQGPPGTASASTTAVNPAPAVGFESNNVQDGFEELAGDIKQIIETETLPTKTLDW